MDWISAAWATMLLKQGVISAENAPEAARVVLQLWEFDFAEDERGIQVGGGTHRGLAISQHQRSEEKSPASAR